MNTVVEPHYGRRLAIGLALIAVIILAVVLVVDLLGPPLQTTGRAPRSTAAANPVVTPPSGPDTILVGAGDIAQCDGNAAATAALVAKVGGTVFTAGDNAYNSGTNKQFSDCYQPTWGPFRDRTRPSPGNHDYGTPGAAGYYRYFGAAAGDPSTGYYSYDLGAWHIIALNSNCAKIGGCGAGSRQEQWLRADLAAHPRACTLAYWHHPRFSSGQHGNDLALNAVWEDLYRAGVDVVINGHDHDYERFAPQDPNGSADPAKGIREFVVGTGGAKDRTFKAATKPNSEVRGAGVYGVIKLTLKANSYDWQFLPIAGETFTDAGSGTCH